MLGLYSRQETLGQDRITQHHQMGIHDGSLFFETRSAGPVTNGGQLLICQVEGNAHLVLFFFNQIICDAVMGEIRMMNLLENQTRAHHQAGGSIDTFELHIDFSFNPFFRVYSILTEGESGKRQSMLEK